MRRAKALGVSSTGLFSLDLFLLLAGCESALLSFGAPLAVLEGFWKAGRAFATDVGGRSKLCEYILQISMRD